MQNSIREQIIVALQEVYAQLGGPVLRGPVLQHEDQLKTHGEAMVGLIAGEYQSQDGGPYGASDVTQFEVRIEQMVYVELPGDVDNQTHTRTEARDIIFNDMLTDLQALSPRDKTLGGLAQNVSHVGGGQLVSDQEQSNIVGAYVLLNVPYRTKQDQPDKVF